MDNLQVREFRKSDFPCVKQIYQEGIDSGLATFETQAKTFERWDKALHPCCRLVACAEQNLVGWAGLSPVSNRTVYSGVAEVSIYVANRFQKKGVGSDLLAALIAASEQNGFWTLQGAIFAKNIASIQLHQRHGFRKIGRREKLAKRDGVWLDVILMERRSQVVGVD